MKKIFLFIVFCLLTVVACTQEIRYKNRNLTLEKPAAVLLFDGLGGVISLNNDVTLTQSANDLTFAGGTFTMPTSSLRIGLVTVTTTGTQLNYLNTATSDIQTQIDGKVGYPGAGIPLSTGAAWGAPIVNNSANWNTAYGWGDHAGLYDPVGTGAGAVGTHEATYNHANYNTAHADRFKWDGGATGLTAATGRTSLELNNLTNNLQVAVKDSTGGTGHYATWDDMTDGLALKVPYSDVEDEDVELAGDMTSASVTTGGVTTTTATITDLTVSGDLDARFRSDRIDYIEGTTISGKRYEMEWEVDTTANTPAAGDSIYTDARFADMHVDVWCSDTVTGQLCLMNENYWEADKYSYEFTDATGVFTFHPKLATAQVVRIVGTNSALWATLTPPAAPFHAFYQAVYDGYTSKPSEAVANACNKWITSLDTIDYWSGGTSVLDRLNFLLVPAIDVNSTNEALMWWTDPNTYATNISGTEWTSGLGFTGDGIADNINTGFIPNGIVSQNDCSFAIYLTIDQQEAAAAFGVDNGGYRIQLTPRNSDWYTARINLSSGTSMTGPIAGSDGFFVLTRTASDACSLYRNGSLVETETDVSAGVPSGSICILHTNGLTDYSTNQFAIFMIWDGVNHADEVAAVNTVTEICADEMGFGVQP